MGQPGRPWSAYRSFRRTAAEDLTDAGQAGAAPDARVYRHPLLRPLRPLYRVGPVTSWLIALGVVFGLRAVRLYPLAALFAVGWFIYCVYSWVAPPLVRRLLRGRT